MCVLKEVIRLVLGVLEKKWYGTVAMQQIWKKRYFTSENITAIYKAIANVLSKSGHFVIFLIFFDLPVSMEDDADAEFVNNLFKP